MAVIQNLNDKPGIEHNEPVQFNEFTDHSFDNLIGGEVYITKNGGESWDRINDPETNEVSGKAAYIFVTNDFGLTWKKITDGLPNSPVNVVIEDRKNPSLLFAGNDLGVYVSVNKGENWMPLKANMPATVVRDIMIHPRENDLIVGTYGRAAWITDISPLQQFTSEIENKKIHLFDIEPKPQLNFSQQAFWGNYQMTGSNHLNSPNEPNGLEIWYFTGKEIKDSTRFEIENMEGEVVYTQQNAGILLFWLTKFCL